MSTLVAQKQLPPSLQDYTINWGNHVTQMMDAVGFELPATKSSFGENPGLSYRAVELQLDSTITYSGYNILTPDSIPVLRNVHTRPQSNKEVITEAYYAFDHWSALSRTELVSDNLGRLIETVAYTYDEANMRYMPDSRIDVYPHGNSIDLVDSFFVSAWSEVEKDFVRALSVWNTFDVSGRLLESLSAIEFFEIPIVFIDRYHYNPDGHNTLIESFIVDGGQEIPAGRQELFYENNLLSIVTTLISDGIEGFVPETKTTYSYTTAKKEELIQLFGFDLEKNDWKLQQVDGYVYDEIDRVKQHEEVIFDEQGISRHLTSLEYELDEYLSVVAGHVYDNIQERWILEDRKFYYYDALSAVDPHTITDKALFLYPNPSQGTVQIKLTGKVSAHVYTLSGQVIRSFYLAPGEKLIDLSDLPAGLYQVRARSDEDYYSGKLIIQ
jgi:hypothetical protein